MPEERASRYEITEVADVDAVCAELRAAHGEQVCVVAKERRLFTWRGVRIHLDRVEGLGAFIELEAVAAPESDLSAERSLVRELRDAFGIADERLVRDGYAALLGAAARTSLRSTAG